MSLVIVRVFREMKGSFKFQGTAFFINENTLITAKHVVENPVKQGYKIYVSDTSSGGGKLHILSEDIEFCDRDIAILKTRRKFPIEEVAFTDLELESQIQIKGYHNENGTINSSYHTVSGYVNHEHTYELHSHITNGFSGSPIIFKDKVFGIATAVHRKDNITYMIPISECAEQLKKHKITVKKIYPFIGLQAFNQSNSHFFFGRSTEIQSLLKQLDKDNLIAIVGDSGSGKSSLVKAGIIPHYLEKNNDTKSVIRFKTIEMRPAENPFDELIAVVSKICHELQLSPRDTDYYKNKIEPNNPKAVRAVFQELFKAQKTYLLFYIDQFEELFTLSKEPYQEPFIALLLYLYNNQLSHLKIQILFTIRLDSYHFENKYDAFYTIVEQGKYRLKLMKDQALEDCVVEPLVLGGIERNKAKEFSDEILIDMDENQDSSLTLLQIALTQTWHHKKEDNTLFDAYKETKKIRGALDKLATDTMTSLVNNNELVFESIFMRLMKFGDNNTKVRRRRLADKEEFSKEEWEIVKKLASLLDANGNVTISPDSKGGRLLLIHGKETDNHDDGKQMVELVHESLLTQWKVYEKWINNVANQIALKRFHELVINKTKEHKRKEASFLMGSDLNKGLSLLKSDYKRFLSEDEIAYVEGSLKARKKSKWVKVFVVLSVIIMLGIALLFYTKWDYEKNREVREFSTLVQNYQRSNNLMSKRKLIADAFHYPKQSKKLKKYIQALDFYNQLIMISANDKDLEILKYRLYSIYNKGNIFMELKQNSKSIKTYNHLILLFKNNKDKEIIKYIAMSYGQLAWLYILKKNYKKSLILSKKGGLLKKNYYWIDINLAHAYLLLNQNINLAKKIYLKYADHEEDILNDFKNMKKYNIETLYFKEIKTHIRIYNGKDNNKTNINFTNSSNV
ncbi:MAG TPA: serine protease [Arcobacter sp.]|nr:serine protease [Arcobacter sp.]